MKKGSLPPKSRFKGLASVKGWLGDDAPFFKEMQKIVTDRKKQKIRRVHLPKS